MTTIKTLHEIVADCGFDFNAITEAQNDAIHENALSLTEVLRVHLHNVFIEILEFEHEGEPNSYTVYVAHHDHAIFEEKTIGSRFVGAFKMCNVTDALHCYENIVRMIVATY